MIINAMSKETFSFDNIISITDLREDIDTLTKRLVRYPYTVIFKNRQKAASTFVTLGVQSYFLQRKTNLPTAAIILLNYVKQAAELTTDLSI